MVLVKLIVLVFEPSSHMPISLECVDCQRSVRKRAKIDLCVVEWYVYLMVEYQVSGQDWIQDECVLVSYLGGCSGPPSPSRAPILSSPNSIVSSRSFAHAKNYESWRNRVCAVSTYDRI